MTTPDDPDGFGAQEAGKAVPDMSSRSAGTGAPTRLVTAVPAVATELASLRRHVVDHLRTGGAGDDVIADLELVVSELATNVIQHTPSDTITVAVDCVEGAWVIDVYDAEKMPDPAHRGGPPAVDVPTGRGLVIAAALSDTIELVQAGGRTLVRCTRTVAPRT